MAKKIFDCFTFFNEMEILDLRLLELYHEVDHFVLVESTSTFTGNKKPLIFNENKEKYKKYLGKIIHIIVDDFPETTNAWGREDFQRAAIRRGLTQASDDDLVIITDADEILSRSAIRKSRELEGHIQFNMDVFAFYMNLCSGKSDWRCPYGFSWKDRDKIPDFSRARWVKGEMQDAFAGRYHILENAGWHFTHLGGAAKVREKFKAYCHVDDPWPKAMANDGALERQILAGGQVGSNKDLSKFVPVDQSFPQTVIEREQYYKDIGFLIDPYRALAELQAEYQELRISYARQVYDDNLKHPALGGTTGAEFLRLAGVENPFVGKVTAAAAPMGILLSRGRPATQSSVSEWSKEAIVELDAAGALDGNLTGEAKFHTSFEDAPWWMIDLEQIYRIQEIRIYNRILPKFPDDDIAARASRLKIEAGEVLYEMNEIFRKDDDTIFGGMDGRPLVVKINQLLRARFIRITLLRPNFLHFDQVEIYGGSDF